MCIKVLVAFILGWLAVPAGAWRVAQPSSGSGATASEWASMSEEVIEEVKRVAPTPEPGTLDDAASSLPGEGVEEPRPSWDVRRQSRYAAATRPHRGWIPSRSVGRSLPFHHPGIDSVSSGLVREEVVKVVTGIDVVDTYMALLRIFNIKLYVRERDYTLPTNPVAHLHVALTDGDERFGASFVMRESDDEEGVFYLDDPEEAMREIGWVIEAFFKKSRPQLVFLRLDGVLPKRRPFTPAYSIRLADIPVETGARFHHYPPENPDVDGRRINMDGWFLR